MEYRFIVIDYWSSYSHSTCSIGEVLCKSDNLMDCYLACLKRCEDTDGECDVRIEDSMSDYSFRIEGVYCDECEKE